MGFKKPPHKIRRKNQNRLTIYEYQPGIQSPEMPSLKDEWKNQRKYRPKKLPQHRYFPIWEPDLPKTLEQQTEYERIQGFHLMQTLLHQGADFKGALEEVVKRYPQNWNFDEDYYRFRNYQTTLKPIYKKSRILEDSKKTKLPFQLTRQMKQELGHHRRDFIERLYQLCPSFISLRRIRETLEREFGIFPEEAWLSNTCQIITNHIRKLRIRDALRGRKIKPIGKYDIIDPWPEKR